MTTISNNSMKIGPNTAAANGRDRRQHRRHDFEQKGIPVDRWDGRRRVGKPFGEIVDLSASGVRIRSKATVDVRPDTQIRLRLELPDYAGISPFITRDNDKLAPKTDWVGWMSVARVSTLPDGTTEIAGRLADMDEMDRGMLGLYLSTQPLAA